MRKTIYPIYISKRKEHSYANLDIRAKKDVCLYNDAEDFMIKHPTNFSGLVDMLLDNQFSHSRFTDPEYPM